MRLVDLFEATNLDRKIASTFQNKISTKLVNDPSAPDVEPLDFVEWVCHKVHGESIQGYPNRGS